MVGKDARSWFMEFSQALSTEMELSELSDLMLTFTVQQAQADGGSLLLLDEAKGELIPKASLGLVPGQVPVKLGQGIVGWVAEQNEPLLIVAGEPEALFGQELQDNELSSILCLPLYGRGKVIGVLSLTRQAESAPFARSQLETLSLLSGQAAAAIEKAHLYEQTKRRLLESNALFEIGKGLTSVLQLDELLQLIVDSVMRVIPDANKSVIHILDPAGEKLLAKASSEGKLAAGAERPLHVGEGIAGWAVQQREAVYVPNIDNDPHFVTLRPEATYKSLLVVPLMVGDKVFGTLSLDSNGVDAFTPDDERLLATLASQAAIAVENAQLYEEIRRFNLELEQRIQERTRELAEEKERMEALYAIARELSASLDIDKVLERALTKVSEAVGAKQGSVLLLDRASDTLIRRAVLERDKPLLQNGEVTPFKPGVGLAGWVLEHVQPMLLGDVTRDERWLPDWSEETEIRSLIAVPLAVEGGDVYGVLIVSDNQVDYFTEAHLKLVLAAASQVATALDNATLYQYVSEQAVLLGQALRSQQEETSKSEAILQSIADGVVVNDAHGVILLVNSAAEHILGWSAESVLGQDVRTVFEVFSPGGREEALAGIESLMASAVSPDFKSETIQTMLETADRVVSAHLAPVVAQSDEFLGIVTVFRDITKEAEADRAKRKFITGISHELRTPMTSVKGYTDLLYKGRVGDINKEQRKFLYTIKSNADRLAALINDLIDLAQLEEGPGKLDLRPLQMEQMIREATSLWRRPIEEKGLTLEVDVAEGLPDVRGDRERIAQVLANLLSNAYQYTLPGGRIALSVSLREDVLQVDVTDTGIGIAPEDQDRVFDRFYRADHPVVQQESGGAGLGLALAKMFVEMQGGRIWVDSELGQGSTFSFILPTLPSVLPPPVASL
jgi:PAS domain S-box-containing protein